jgi:dihydroxyacetone kinase-like predicted kinase
MLAVGQHKVDVAKAAVAAMVDEDSEVISIYYGADVKEESAEALAAELEELYPDCEIELNAGGQPIYYYIISVE